MIKISVVIPIYNDALFIDDCVRSVLTQSYTEIELILVDDGSTDESSQVIQTIKDSRLQYLRIKHSGAAAARNAGVKKAQGELLAFLDADDLWAKDKLSTQLSQYQSGSLNFTYLREFMDTGGNAIHLNSPTPGISPITLLISRKDFLKIGMFEEKLWVAEFIEWQDRAKHHAMPFHMLDKVLSFRRIHADNIGRVSKPNAHQYASSIKMILDRKRQSCK